MTTGFPPIIIFTYNRVDELQLTVESLMKCNGIENHEIIVFSDGPKNIDDAHKTSVVSSYLENLKRKRNIKVVRSNSNKGLANSIINGINKVFEKHESVIVLEDDLVLAPNFLCFMNQALSYYKNDLRIFSISGYSPKITIPESYKKDIYFSPRASSWGWGTWKDRWETVDWEVKNYKKFQFDLRAICQFSRGGTDLPGMLRNQMNRRINSWAIRWVYQQFLNKQATVYPRTSKLISIGFGKNATHTKKTTRFITELDNGNQRLFHFEPFVQYNKRILKSFRKVYSIKRRILDKLS